MHCKCPLLALSGHGLVHCICPLMTQSGHTFTLCPASNDSEMAAGEFERSHDVHRDATLIFFFFLSIVATFVFFFVAVTANCVGFLALLACCT